MANFAVIVDGVVENIIIAETLEIASEVTENICVEYTDESPAHIGAKYNFETGFEQPIILIEAEPIAVTDPVV
jgi:hypothetical protein